MQLTKCSEFSFEVDCALYYTGFENRFVIHHSFEWKPGQVQGAVFAVGDQFRDSSARRWGLLQAVAREARAEKQITYFGVIADDRILNFHFSYQSFQGTTQSSPTWSRVL